MKSDCDVINVLFVWLSSKVQANNLNDFYLSLKKKKKKKTFTFMSIILINDNYTFTRLLQLKSYFAPYDMSFVFLGLV